MQLLTLDPHGCAQHATPARPVPALRASCFAPAARSSWIGISARPNEYRVNGPLTNMAEFHQAFNITDGCKMWKGVGERVDIW